MAIVRDETRSIAKGEDVVTVRQLVREWSVAAGFGLIDQTKIVTAASEAFHALALRIVMAPVSFP